MFFHDVSAEAKLYYIFMLADGESTNEEQKKFDEICMVLEVDKRIKNEIIKFCSTKMIGYSSNFQEIKTIIEEVLNINKDRNIFNLSIIDTFLSDHKARIIWTMINLGYSDNDFTQIEKSIIAYLVDIFELENVLYSDMLDSADTILALTERKDWVKNQKWSYDKTHSELVRTDDKIKQIYKNVQVNIDEIPYINEA